MVINKGVREGLCKECSYFFYFVTIISCNTFISNWNYLLEINLSKFMIFSITSTTGWFQSLDQPKYVCIFFCFSWSYLHCLIVVIFGVCKISHINKARLTKAELRTAYFILTNLLPPSLHISEHRLCTSCKFLPNRVRLSQI